MNRLMPFGMVVFGLVVLSCSGPPEKQDLTPEETYFQEFDLISSETNNRLELLYPAFQAFAQDGGGRPPEENEQIYLAQTGPNFPLIIEAYKGEAEQISKLEPPDSLVEGHRVRIESMLTRIRMLELESLPAFMANDFAAVKIAAAKRGLLNQQLIRGWPQHYCLAWAGDHWPCYPENGVPGGSYGEAVWRLLRDYTYAAASYNMLEVYSDGTLIRGYQFMAPELVAESEDVLRKLTILTPPEEYRRGHEALQHNFELEVEQMKAIASAAEAGNILVLRRLLSEGPDEVGAWTLPDNMEEIAEPISVFAMGMVLGSVVRHKGNIHGRVAPSELE